MIRCAIFRFAPLLAAALLTGWGHAASVKAAKDRREAPEFVLKDSAGKTVRLSDFRGRVVLLNFWATWCVPCKTEIPWFNEFETKQREQGLTVLGVSLDEKGWEVVKPFMSEHGMTYRVIMGTDAIAETYSKLDKKISPNLDKLPTTFLIDREGRVAAVHEGFTARKEFEEELQELLSARASGAERDRI